MYYARILIEDARFPPFGFDTEEISSNMTENMSQGPWLTAHGPWVAFGFVHLRFKSLVAPRLN